MQRRHFQLERMTVGLVVVLQRPSHQTERAMNRGTGLTHNLWECLERWQRRQLERRELPWKLPEPWQRCKSNSSNSKKRKDGNLPNLLPFTYLRSCQWTLLICALDSLRSPHPLLGTQ